MCFSKSFPLQLDDSHYPTWIEVEVTDKEGHDVEEECRIGNIELLKKNIDDAKRIFKEKKLKEFQSDLVNTALALFKKNASHVFFWKEEKAKDKFNKRYKF